MTEQITNSTAAADQVDPGGNPGGAGETSGGAVGPQSHGGTVRNSGPSQVVIKGGTGAEGDAITASPGTIYGSERLPSLAESPTIQLALVAAFLLVCVMYLANQGMRWANQPRYWEPGGPRPSPPNSANIISAAVASVLLIAAIVAFGVRTEMRLAAVEAHIEATK